MNSMIIEAGSAPGSGEFLGVDWGSIALVCITTLVATVVIVTFYSLGLRLLAVGSRNDDEHGVQGSSVAVVQVHRPLVATLGAVACIAVGVRKQRLPRICRLFSRE